MKDTEQKIDEILDASDTRYIHQAACASAKVKHPKDCDCTPYDTLSSAKQAILQLITEARLDQIMRDFLKHSLCTEVDESILIEIRKSQEEQVHEELRKEIK